MAYTRDGIMAQVWVAFGQGTGMFRVSQDAAMELHRWYYNAITEEIVSTVWDKEAVAVLERIRAIGRLAALNAANLGATAISADDVFNAANQVQKTSDTLICPPAPGPPTLKD